MAENRSTGGKRVQSTKRTKAAGSGKKAAFWGIVAAAAAAVFLIGLAVYGVFLHGAIYPGVSMNGLDLSGMTQAEALAELTDHYQGISPADHIEVVIGEDVHTLPIAPEDMGYDARKTAESAYFYGRQGGFFQRLGDIITGITKGVDLSPSFAVNETQIRDKVYPMAQDLNHALSQSAWSVEDGVLLLDRGQAGITIDEKELLTFVTGRLAAGDFSQAVFPVDRQEPDALDLLLIKSEIECEMSEPRLDLENDPTGKTILPAQQGIAMDLEQAKRLLDTAQDRYVRIPLTVTEPTYTTEEYQSMLFRDVLGQCTTDFNKNLIGRTTNVLLATGFCNNVLLNPGDTFSYNKTVGPRTYERGFMDATVYVGTEAEEGVGGGICQVSSTIYYACLRADLEIAQRWAHSRLVTYVPLGEDATVAWGSKDFQFTNNTDFPIRIVTSNTANTITVKLLGTKTVNKTVKMETRVLSKTPFETVYQKDETLPLGTEKVDKNGYTGYVTETYRVVYIDGKEVSRTFENKSVYTKYDKVILHNLEIDPNAPVDPTAPTVPTTPTAPTQPTAPVTPTEPTAPSQPSDPAPTEPANPLSPVITPSEPQQ